MKSLVNLSKLQDLHQKMKLKIDTIQKFCEQKQSKYLLMDEWDKQNVIYIYNGLFFKLKKE